MPQDTPPVAPNTATRRRGRNFALSLAAALAAGAAYVGACALVPLPAPTVEFAVPQEQRFAVDDAAAQAAVDAYDRPTAVGWLDGDDASVWANDDTPQPLASITKLVTVLVGQERDALEPGSDGPSYTWTAADVEFQEELLADDGIAFPIDEGTGVTRREMLTLALIPSANDFATAYAYSIFGDNAGFVAAVDDWAARNGFGSLTIREPSGMDDGNVASAADVLRISRLVLADPVLAEIVGTESATLPWGIGEVTNTNALLGSMSGAIGVKTGHTETAGYSLAAAARGEYADRELTRMAVVLGRDTEEERTKQARAVLNGLAELPERQAVTTGGEYLGTLTSVDGQFLELSADASSDLVLVPGEEATRTLLVGSAATSSGTGTGERIEIKSPQGDVAVGINREGAFTAPSLRWRITHPRALFGF